MLKTTEALIDCLTLAAAKDLSDEDFAQCDRFWWALHRNRNDAATAAVAADWLSEHGWL